MADLDFSHGVQEIPKAAELPKPLGRQVSTEVTDYPKLQESVANYGKSTNWMSAIGAQVASRASNAIASKLGTDLGKNPKGDIGIPLTEFDDVMQKSYNTQAHATLGLQADKLITESNLEAAKAGRMTPELINKTNQSISKGLQNIFQHAPEEIRSQLEKTYGSLQLNQVEQMSKRMLSEQHEDLRNNTILSNNQNAENAHALASSGKFKEAEQILKTTQAINNSTVARNVGFTPQQAKVGNDTVRQSINTGKLQYGYEQADALKKGPEYLQGLAKKPDWISDADYMPAMQTLRSYVSNKQALSSQSEQLTMTQFEDKMATSIGTIPGTELQSALDKLSPNNAASLKLKYDTALTKYTKEHHESNDLINNWSDPTAQANASASIKNQGFNEKVAYQMNANPNLSREDAESQVAASAGGVIPVFTSTLHNKLWSGDPAQMVAASEQMAKLQTEGNGHALQGLSEMDLGMASDIKHNYNHADPTAAARMIIQNKQNQDVDYRKQSNAEFDNKLYENTKKVSKSTDDYILDKFGMSRGLFHPTMGFDSAWNKSLYATDILSNYRNNFNTAGRDDARATELTNNYIANNYGKTSVNGSSEWTLHPIEKACGFNQGQGLPIIYQDMINQMTPILEKQKSDYDAKLSNEYWKVEPITEDTKKHKNDTSWLHLNERELTQGVKVTKYSRHGVQTDTNSYTVKLVGNNFNWDINVKTKDGDRSIFLEDPTFGIFSYTPNVKWIQDNHHG